jgi:ABC-type dipeptide/oligopeptide/nickel transport system ATPase component
MNALDPVYRVGAQIVEAIRTHEDCSSRGLGRPRSYSVRRAKTEWVRRYPHEFSGGMRQRHHRWRLH